MFSYFCRWKLFSRLKSFFTQTQLVNCSLNFEAAWSCSSYFLSCLTWLHGEEFQLILRVMNNHRITETILLKLTKTEKNQG